MTGVCFANILKYKEHDKGKQAQPSTTNKNGGSKAAGATASKEEDKKEEEAKVEAKTPRINF
jgi:hypothetical protein